MRKLACVCLLWAWTIPCFFAASSYYILIDEGIPDISRRQGPQFDFNFVSPVTMWLVVTGVCMAASCAVATFIAIRRKEY